MSKVFNQEFFHQADKIINLWFLSSSKILLGIYCNKEVLEFLTFFTPFKAKFHVPVPVHLLSGWETGDIMQKMGDVTHLMKGCLYVGCQFILISYFVTKFGE